MNETHDASKAESVNAPLQRDPPPPPGYQDPLKTGGILHDLTAVDTEPGTDEGATP